jgi:hypothetical protein
MPPKNKLKLGRDAVVSVLAKYIHPSEHIRRVHPNAVANLRIENLTVLRKDRRRINRKEQDVIVFVSEAYRTSVTEGSGALFGCTVCFGHCGRSKRAFL